MCLAGTRTFQGGMAQQYSEPVSNAGFACFGRICICRPPDCRLRLGDTAWCRNAQSTLDHCGSSHSRVLDHQPLQILTPILLRQGLHELGSIRRHALLRFERGTVVVMGRGYIDCEWFVQLTLQTVHFVTRLKDNASFEVVAVESGGAAEAPVVRLPRPVRVAEHALRRPAAAGRRSQSPAVSGYYVVVGQQNAGTHTGATAKMDDATNADNPHARILTAPPCSTKVAGGLSRGNSPGCGVSL
jgi:hypothetical protein